MSPYATEHTPELSKSEKVFPTRATPTDSNTLPSFNVMAWGKCHNKKCVFISLWEKYTKTTLGPSQSTPYNIWWVKKKEGGIAPVPLSVYQVSVIVNLLEQITCHDGNVTTVYVNATTVDTTYDVLVIPVKDGTYIVR